MYYYKRDASVSVSEEFEMCSIWWWETKTSGWSYGCFILPTIMWLYCFIALCLFDYVLLIFEVNIWRGYCFFVFFGSEVSSSALPWFLLNKDWWLNKAKIHLGCLLPDEEWKWSSSSLCLLDGEVCCQTFYSEIPNVRNG